MKPIVTRVGFAEHGKNWFCGRAVGAELAGGTGWPSLLSLAVAGRPLDAADAAVLEDATVCTLAADPRIWPLKVTRLVSSYGGVMAGYCAGHVLLEDAIMGPWPTGGAASFLREAREALGDRAGDDGALRAWVGEQVGGGRRLPGFGVPFRPEDERLVAFGECLRRRGRDRGTFWRLAMRLDAVMWAHKKVHANQSLGLAAVLLDLGFEPPQIPVLTTAIVDLCCYANAVEEAGLRSSSLQRLPAECVTYVGRAPRTSPRAEAGRALDSRSPALVDPAFR